jgi:carbamoyltransferase
MTDKQRSLFGIDKLNVPRSDIPAITHVDYSARIQTVDGKYNQRYYRLIERFYEKTGCPVIVNTSFNVRGEPIVCTPEDAYRCFMRTEMDTLVLGEFVLLRNEQPEWEEKKDWREESRWIESGRIK